MSWLSYILLASLGWAAHIISLRLLGDRLPATATTFLFTGLSLLTVGLIMAWQKQTISWEQAVQPTTLALLFVAGIAIGLTDYWVVSAYANGGKLSVAGPIFSVLGLSVMSLFGIMALSEGITVLKLIGFVFAAISIILLNR